MKGQTQVAVVQNPVERRRHMRYRLVQAIFIRQKNQSSHRATTSEISISGLSAISREAMAVGENVTLSPVGGGEVRAIIRRKTGDTYGFEFLDPSPRIVEEIHILCRGLFPFRGEAELRDPN